MYIYTTLIPLVFIPVRASLPGSHSLHAPSLSVSPLCLCLSLSLPVCLSVFLCLPACVSVCLSVPVCRSVCLSLCVSVSVSVFLCLCLFVLSLSVCLSVCLSLSLSLSFCAYLCLSLSLSLFLKVPYVETPELSQVLSFKPGISRIYPHMFHLLPGILLYYIFYLLN